MVEITLKSRWHEIFGEKGEEIPANIRRERWERWKQISLDAGGKETVDWWSGEISLNGCLDCVHRDKDWCELAGLPCTVNPITTFQLGQIGMACIGTGFRNSNKILKQ